MTTTGPMPTTEHATSPSERRADRSDTEIAATLFRGFADPTRLALLLGLLDGERRVTELVEVVGRSQATVSEHLGLLRSSGLVDARPQGRQTFYRLATAEVVELLLVAQRLLAATGEHVRLCDQHDLDTAHAADHHAADHDQGDGLR